MTSPVKVVILGAKGMLGTDLMHICRNAGLHPLGLDRDEVDITQYDDLLAKTPPSDWLVNCAAYTNVDGAESERGIASAINATGAANAARVCAATGASLLHISTDYVFDGALDRPYREDDAPNPINHYGETKLAAEIAIRAAATPWIILRTQSLFGAHGRNFARAILKRLDTSSEPVSVVDDQISSPTYTQHLSAAIVALLGSQRTGIVHVSASGACSWFQFAQAIADRVGAAGRIRPIPSTGYPTPARRPHNAILDKTRFTSWTGQTLPPWEIGLQQYLAEIGRG